jgi:uncharacterized phage protein (TIGR01671 family)
MKVTKFRIWNTKTNKWVHGPGEEPNLLGETILLGAFMPGIGIMELNDCIVCQYSGIGDKNGKEIYEGDILSYRGRNGFVEFFAGMFMVSWYDQTDDTLGLMTTDEVEVVGNIYENRELLHHEI